MSDADYPSGQWVGFYTYPHESRRYLMDLILEFRDGRVSGEGADDIGFFGIEGHYCPEEGECDWIKTYHGKHSVEYSGYREKEGIWGLWNIGAYKGGFHIWPIGGSDLSLEQLREEIEKENSLASPSLAPQVTVSP